MRKIINYECFNNQEKSCYYSQATVNYFVAIYYCHESFTCCARLNWYLLQKK